MINGKCQRWFIVCSFGLLMSLNMLIEIRTGFNYTFNDFDRWVHQIGFKKTDWINLAGSDKRSDSI